MNKRGRRKVPASESQAVEDLAEGAPLAVVGIGASAGGLSALKAFFGQVPADSGLAFVVVVHLSPDHESHMEEILQPYAAIPVQQVTETVPLEKDRVYIIPPGANIEAIDTHLRLTPLEKQRRQRAPVDHFFRTLAETHDGHSVAVILTGSGSDGAQGIKAVKEEGGLIVVQDPNDAEYDGMPQSAVATGVVDLVLPLAEIPEAVIRIARTKPRIAAEAVAEEAEDADAILQKIFGQVRARTGRDFARYKRTTLMRRISRRMQLRGLAELPAYLEVLRAEPEEVRLLADDFLITVTTFFRDPYVYEKLAKDVLPRIFDRKSGPQDELRVWSVGCATGEEAYSLAILLLEEAARRDSPPSLHVFASDLHERSLERAREGFYSEDIAADVGKERLAQFFERANGFHRIHKEVRELVVFAPHNLLADPPFSRIDLISCRNLLIYLDRGVQQEVNELFHYALRPDGYLVLGGAEVVVQSDLFAVDDKQTSIYRKLDVPTPDPRLPVFHSWSHAPPKPHTSSAPAAAQQPSSYGAIHQQLLERHGPSSLLVGPGDNVMNVTGDAGRYMIVPTGELTSSPFKLVREELRLELRAAITEARRNPEGPAICTKPIAMGLDGAQRLVMLRVGADRRQEGFVAVVFEEPALAQEAPKANACADESTRERELEEENNTLRQRLQTVIEEYETGREEMRASNEELQSANEEFRSTLEELDTSKEELHSMNEELQTVNQENRHKVEELAQLTGDLQNLLSSTDIATLFLDRQLRIMRFTPKVEALFNIRRIDRGRPISDITSRLAYEELVDDANAVLKRLVPVEREVQDKTGCWYFVRVLPYRSSTERIEGVVVTALDVTAVKAAEQSLHAKSEELRKESADKEVFIAMLGHEIRNPLAALDGSRRLVERGIAEPKDVYPKMAHHIERLVALVNDLLEVSRIARGKATLKKRGVDLAELLRVVANDAQQEVTEKGLELGVALPDALYLEGDPVRLEQVFANLLSNAMKFTPRGGRIEVQASRHGNDVVVEVRDTGCGVSAEQRERIFAPFVQDRPNIGGLGIGLPLARGLIDLHGGSVGVTSEGHGKGSVFEVRLPRGDPDRARSEVSEETCDQFIGNLRVLLVDDMRDAADTLAMLLWAEGVDTRCAYTGEAALEMAREWWPDAALVDIGLPDISGFEVARGLRGSEKSILLLAVTGFSTEDVAEKTREAGFDGHLIKPLDLKKLRELLVKHRARVRP